METMSPEKRQAMGLAPSFEVYEKWFTIVRVIGVLLVCGLILLLSNLNIISFDPAPIIYVIGPIFFFSSIIWFLLRRQKPITMPQIYLELLGDIVAITAGIHFAGGTRSPFIFIYIAICVTASTISIPVTLIISTLTIVSYLAMFSLEHSTLIPTFTLYSAIEGGEIIEGSVLILTIAFIAFQSSFYISRIKKEDKKMLKKEEELRKFKEDFLFKTVHDLRAPSTSIRLAIEELSSSNMYACSADANKTIAIIETLDQRMLNLVNDILKIGKSENTMMELKKEPANIFDIVEDIAKGLNPIAISRKVALKHEGVNTLPLASVDKEKIVEVFSNLIDNAIKYNKEGGTITITHEVKDKFLETSIADQGVGIPMEDIGKLFVPYFRSATGKGIQGTGLGLYIVKNLIEKMGGTISATSSVGVGTTFTVSLPLA